MAPKVSVVVATYAPGEKLDALVRSVERQTLPADEFEVVLVDDGSPDDTWDRLQTLRDGHGNVRVERIEASGWPSRPTISFSFTAATNSGRSSTGLVAPVTIRPGEIELARMPCGAPSMASCRVMASTPPLPAVCASAAEFFSAT